MIVRNDSLSFFREVYIVFYEDIDLFYIHHLTMKGRRIMKVVVEKYVCDGCGKELDTTKRHYVISFGTSDSWNDVETHAQHRKDVCSNCYKTILSLVGNGSIENELTPIKRNYTNKASYDKDLIKELWAQGLTYKEISAKLGVKTNQILYVVKHMSEKERKDLKDKYITNVIEEERIPRMEVTTDQQGYVLSVKEKD